MPPSQARVCGVGLCLGVFDDFHFKAGALYVQEVLPGGAAADSGRIQVRQNSPTLPIKEPYLTYKRALNLT